MLIKKWIVKRDVFIFVKWRRIIFLEQGFKVKFQPRLRLKSREKEISSHFRNVRHFIAFPILERGPLVQEIDNVIISSRANRLKALQMISIKTVFVSCLILQKES